MIGSFQKQTKFHDNYATERAYVGHHILSFSQEDMMILSESQITDITNQYIKDAGLTILNMSLLVIRILITSYSSCI
jgi:hypothetical protein